MTLNITNWTLNNPEHLAKKETFKTTMHERRMALRNMPKLSRPRKQRVTNAPRPRKLFKGAGKK
jgi:hypothetical protein